MRGLLGRKLPMLSKEDLEYVDSKYSSIVTTAAYDVTIMSRNRGHDRWKMNGRK